MQMLLGASHQQLRQGAASFTWQQGSSNILKHMAALRSAPAAARTANILASSGQGCTCLPSSLMQVRATIGSTPSR